MLPDRVLVFLPCHSLDDFPTWLDDREADGLLAAWTAAWHPALIAAVGSPPAWASVDLPVPQAPVLGIVPAEWDDRFAAQFDAASASESRFVRRAAGGDGIQREAAERLSIAPHELAAAALVPDFHALGLAALLADLLARRMRMPIDLESTGFSAAVVAAARAAAAGDEAAATAALEEAFGALSTTRARYYPVDSYIVDLVLLAPTTNGQALAAAVSSPVPVAVAGAGQAIEALARTCPVAVEQLRRAVAEFRAELCGGRDADDPLDLATPESVLDSLHAGLDRFRHHVGAPPASFARVSGGAVPLLVPLIAGLGLEGGVWSAFDGSSLPDVGGGLIRWRSGPAAVDLVAATPIDARSAAAVLAIPATLGATLDRDHVAVILFAHYAGTASQWHGLIRRIGRWTNLLGTFVTPRELSRRAGGSGVPVSLEPDAFPPTLPSEAAGHDAIAQAVEAAAGQAAAIVTAAAPWRISGPRPEAVRPTRPEPPSVLRRLGFAIPRRHASDAGRLSLDNGLVRVEIHPQTGGVLAIRRDREAANRLTQQLAVRRSTAAATRGGPQDPAEDTVVSTRMVADAVERVVGSDGFDEVVSSGRLVAADGGTAVRFRQRVRLAASLPLALLDVEMRLERPLVGPLLTNHVAARFAWHENEHVEIRRSLLTQSVATERTRFTAPHFIEVVPEGSRFDPAADRVVILTGGLPWHLLSTPHVVDSLLAGGTAATVTRRLGIGVGLRSPWDAALAVTAGVAPAAPVPGLPANVRLILRTPGGPGGSPADVRVGLLESDGLAGEVVVDWLRPVGRATAVDFAGAPRSEPAVAIDGTRTVVFLDRYQWLQLDVGFAG